MLSLLPPNNWTKLLPGQRFACINVTSNLITEFQRMVNNSWARGALVLDPLLKGMKITRIFWIQNPLRWKRYQQTKEFIRESQEKSPTALSITKLANYSPWMEHQKLDSSMNEVLLFHGTSSGCRNGIMEGGFDLRLSQEGYFGRGIYFGKVPVQQLNY